jgi:hypothetical protein
LLPSTGPSRGWRGAMARARVAPTLRNWIDRRSCNEPPGKCVVGCDKARAELRALLAVARAAKRVENDWERWDEARQDTIDAFHRALARLERLGRGGRKP